jgi:hypothetical protein
MTIGQFELPDRRADNFAVQQRALSRARANGRMGDYPAALPNQILVTKGAGEVGPVTSPTVAAPIPTDTTSLLQEIIALLRRLPFAMSTEWRTRFPKQPRESVSFVAPGGPTNVPAGTAVAVVTVQVNERFSGFLTHVGVMAAAAALAQIQWQIRINGAVHPFFRSDVFALTNVATPYPFLLELCQNSKVQLVAINTGAVGVDVSGVLLGWTEYLSSLKQYGGAPSSGIG